MRLTAIYSIIFLSLLAFSTPGFAETLVVENENGDFGSGLATEHRIDGENLIVELPEGANAQGIAAVLRERLAQVEITIQAQTLTLRGADPVTLLGQLSRVHVTGEGEDDEAVGIEVGAYGAWHKLSSGKSKWRLQALLPHPPAFFFLTKSWLPYSIKLLSSSR